MAKTDPPNDADDAEEPRQIRPFADMLRELSRGASHDELSVAVNDLIQRVHDTRKAGTIVYTIKVGPMKGDKDAILIEDQIKLRLPEHDRQASLFFVDKHGNPVRDDPNQPAFETLREVGQVNTATGEIRDVK